jgi:hypothetical protein
VRRVKTAHFSDKSTWAREDLHYTARSFSKQAASQKIKDEWSMLRKAQDCDALKSCMAVAYDTFSASALSTYGCRIRMIDNLDEPANRLAFSQIKSTHLPFIG